MEVMQVCRANEAALHTQGYGLNPGYYLSTLVLNTKHSWRPNMSDQQFLWNLQKPRVNKDKHKDRRLNEARGEVFNRGSAAPRVAQRPHCHGNHVNIVKVISMTFYDISPVTVKAFNFNRLRQSATRCQWYKYTYIYLFHYFSKLFIYI